MQNVQVLIIAVAVEGREERASETRPLRNGVLGKDNNLNKVLDVRRRGK